VPVLVVSVGVADPRVEQQVASEDVDRRLDALGRFPADRKANALSSDHSPHRLDRVLLSTDVACPLGRIDWVALGKEFVAMHEVEAFGNKAPSHHP